MGFWKTMTEATMTMTLLRQLPTECVTGVTLCKIMYDTCTVSEGVKVWADQKKDCVQNNNYVENVKYCCCSSEVLP